MPLDEIFLPVSTEPEHQSISPSVESIPSYYRNERPELLERVPLGAKTILELGCGAGRLGASVKARQGGKVIGIEYSASAAQVAKGCLDEVYQVDLNQFIFPWQPGTFDCVIAGDVLEHLIDPWSQLASIKSILAKHGFLIASIPNVGFIQIISNLVNGHFEYQDEGILDRTHLRFFTRDTFTNALTSSGFQVAELSPIILPGFQSIIDDYSKGTSVLSIGAANIHVQNMTHLIDLLAYQWLFVAQPIQSPRS